MISQMEQDGAKGIIAGTIIPPTRALDTAIKMGLAMFESKEKAKKVGWKEGVRLFPYVGELFYWWFGAGKEAATKKATTGTSKSSGGTLKRPASAAPGGLTRPKTGGTGLTRPK